MSYSMKQAVQKTGLTEHTLRYYDREGLLPLLQKTASGIRKFSDDDIAWIGLICCLKNSGMSIEHIREFMDLCLQGEKTAEDRKKLLLEHRKLIQEQMKVLEHSLEIVDFKIDHYKEIGIFHIDHQECS